MLNNIYSHLLHSE